MAEVVTNAFINLRDLLDGCGLDGGELLARTGVRIEGETPWVSERTLLDFEKLLEIKAAASRVLDDPDLGLEFAANTQLSAFDVARHVCANAPDVGAAMAMLVECHRLWETGAELQFERDDDQGTFVYRHTVAASPLGRRIDGQHSLGFLARYVQVAARSVSLPATLAFPYPRPASLARYARVWPGACFEFDAKTWALTVPGGILRSSAAGVDGALYASLCIGLRSVLDAVPARDVSFREAVRDAVQQTLPARPTIGAVARRLGVGTRTLQRRLTEADTAYSELLGSVRLRLAQDDLATTQRSVECIASRLGYGSVTAFHRAFFGWTGEPPGAYRTRVHTHADHE